MKPLDKQDLDRFSWDKMSPGIDQKVKKKKRVLYFFRSMMFGFVTLLLLLCCWGIADYSSTVPDSQWSSVDTSPSDIDNIKPINIPEAIAVANTSDQATTVAVSNTEGATIAADEISTRTNSISHHTIEYSQKGNNQTLASGLSSVKTNAQVNEITEIASRTETKLELETAAKAGSIAKSMSNVIDHTADDLAQMGVRSESDFISPMSLLKADASTENRSDIDTPYLSAIKTSELVADIDIHVPLIAYFHPEHEHDISDATSNTIALAFNTNTLIKHPHTPQLGTGFSLGYWLDLGKSHYLGFEYSYQNYKYRFEYPDVVINPSENNVSDNVHEIFSVPVFYGYKLDGYKTRVSLEAGANFTLIKFSTGEISSFTNNAYIVQLLNENYFRKDIGASLLFRTKIDRSVGRNIGVFVRFGANVALRNWYKDDSYVIKPIMINIGLGVRMSF